MFFVTIIWVFLIVSANGKHQISVVPEAISAIIDKHFSQLSATNPGKISVTMIGSESKEFLMFIAKLAKVKRANVTFTIGKEDISEGNHDSQWNLNLDDSSIVFFDSLKRFKEYATKIVWTPYVHKRMHHLVHAPGLKTSHILKTFPDGFAIDHVNYLINENEKSIELATGFMFTEHACRKLQLKTINRFNGGRKKWDNSIFYTQKYQNFHGCELSISNEQESNEKLMSLIFTSKLGATLVRSNETLEFCDITGINNYFDCYRIENESFIIGNPHIHEIYTFSVPPGEPYMDLDRMFMMFEFELWITIAVTLLIGLLATLSLNLVSDKVRNFIAGREVKHPTMNLISIFLTGGQVKTPGRNFARFLFTLFVIWSLIIRTCHQSMLFEFMQADLRRPTLKTIDELFESDFVLLDQDEADLNNPVIYGEDFRSRVAMPTNR